MNKNWEGQIDTKAVGFIEDTEDTENHEICPFPSSLLLTLFVCL